MNSDLLTALKLFLSEPFSQMRAIGVADCCLVSDVNGQRACWPKFFKQLYIADPSSRQVSTFKMQMVDADPPINKSPPFYGVKRGCGKGIVGLKRHLVFAVSVQS